MKEVISLMTFIKAYKAWLDAGAPQGQPFDRGCGLCIQLSDWASYSGLLMHQIMALGGELQDAFILYDKNNDDVDYPFNTFVSYVEETAKEECHLNPQRIAFINWMLSKEQ